MNPLILVAYATKRGSTEEVAREVAGRLSARGMVTDLRSASSVDELHGYDGVVLGGALYMGRLHPDARKFLRRHGEALAKLPVAVFAMGPRTLDEDDVSGARKQLDAALGKEPSLKPRTVTIFGGALDPEQHRFPFNRMEAFDARDWDAIRAWGDEVAADFALLEYAA